MSNGIPLNDSDRDPWLQNIVSYVTKFQGFRLILACSCLKKVYRNVISGHQMSITSKDTKEPSYETIFFHLDGSFDLISSRLQERYNHFMKPNMLKSQFDTLEIPSPQEAHHIDINKSIENILQDITSMLY